MDRVTNNHSRHSRRALFKASVAAASFLLMKFCGAEESKLRKPNASNLETGMFRVRAVLEVNGEIRLKSQVAESTVRSQKAKTDRTAPIKASATIDYDEQFSISQNIRECRSYMNFHEATSEIQIDRNVTKTNLRENCRNVLRLGTDQGVLTTSLDSPLFAAERDLIECPVNSMFLEQLLTDAPVNIADKWKLSNEASCRLLNLDAIQDGKLTVCLVDANEKTIQLDILGRVSASVRQIPTTIEVEGKAQLDRRTGTISWFAVNLDETREISESEPGFHVVAQLRMRRAKIDEMTSGLSLEQVERRVTNLEAASMLQFQSDHGYYRFLASRRWSTYRDNGEEATLRFVVNNRVAAQCNVTNMIDFEPGRQLSMDGFLSDVKKSLGNNITEIVESTEKLTKNNLRLLRVVSQGSVQGVNIRWIHYHVSNDNGRRLVMAFVMNEENLEIFDQEDEQILSTFELLDWPTRLDAKAVEAATPISQPQPKTGEQSRPKLSR